MKAKIIEGTNGFNWGKFLVLKFTEEEWKHYSEINQGPLLRARGWGPEHIWVLDIETGEGFCTRHGGLAAADLRKHEIWVCPMYEPFLEWLYRQDISDLDKLPSTVQLEGESALAGYRRTGVSFAEVFSPRTWKALNEVDIHTFRQLCSMTAKTFTALVRDKKALIEEVQRVMARLGYGFLELRL